MSSCSTTTAPSSRATAAAFADAGKPEQPSPRPRGDSNERRSPSTVRSCRNQARGALRATLLASLQLAHGDTHISELSALDEERLWQLVLGAPLRELVSRALGPEAK
jgi:hypothetical protein